MDYLLICNTGSSSIKLAVFDINSLEELDSASVENIGQAQTVKIIDDSEQDIVAISHQDAVQSLDDWLQTSTGNGRVVAVAHRIVHGGDKLHEPTLIDNQVVSYLESLISLDPEHMPASLEVLRVMRQKYTDCSHVACFDTSFFHDVPTNAQMMSIPRKYYEAGIRRYGFHGLSYRYILDDFRNFEGELAASGKVVIAHLGSGCSLASVVDGKPVDMTMGLTPTSGVMMSSRSGDIDPGVVAYLSRQENMSSESFSRMVNHESGLLGVSGTSADMLTLLNSQGTNPHAAEAVELFCYQISKAIGSLSVTISGLNSLIFSGGIGERSAEIRRRICERLAFLGIEIDNSRNELNGRLISSDSSSVGVHVIHTDEAKSIAYLTRKLIKKGEN